MHSVNVIQQTTLGPVRFRATEKHVRVTCKGQPKLWVRNFGNRFQVTNLSSKEVVSAKEPAKAFAKAVRAFWSK